MAPNTATSTGERDKSYPQEKNAEKTDRSAEYILWHRVFFFTTLQVLAFYSVYLMFTNSMKWYTIGNIFVNYVIAEQGILAGVHRLWAHRTYKAKLPLRLLLVYCNTFVFQQTIIHWARDHRLHHKYSDTDADPTNINRGLFYSHIGWLFLKKSPLVLAKGKEIDVSDLYADPVLRFQEKYYIFLVALICFVIPILIPMHFWNESFINASAANLIRHSMNLNATCLVNSLAHWSGKKPYDKFTRGSQNLGLALYTFGEGWHNYHHAFPYDYKSTEFGNYGTDCTSAFIDLMAKIGWAYDLRTASPETIKKRAQRTGDGSHHLWGRGDNS